MHSHVLSRTVCKSQVSQQVKNLTEACRRPRIDPWAGKIPWRREWLPSAVFLPGESHGQRSLVGYSLWGHKESDTTEWHTQDMNAPKCPSTEDVVCNYIVFKVHNYHWDGTWPFEGPLKWTVWMWGLLLGVNIQNSVEGTCAGWFLHQVQWGKMNSGTCIRFGYTF